MLQKLQCLQPALINNMTPILLHDNAQLHMAQQVLQKLNALGCEVLPHLPYSPDLLPTDYHFFKHLDNFLQGKFSHNQEDAENALQEFIKSRNMDFYTIRISLFLVGKSVSIVMIPILMNKDVFEPSYNDLKLQLRWHQPNIYFIKGKKIERGRDDCGLLRWHYW